MSVEIWRDVPDTPKYEVSSWGRIRNKRSGRIRKLGNVRGYDRFQYFVNGERRVWTLSRLMLTVFVGPPPTDQYHAAHKDGDNRNNELENLTWKTPTANQQDKVRHGTIANGVKNARAKLTDDDVIAIRNRVDPGCPVNGVRAISRDYGMNEGTIRALVAGETWRHV